MEPTMVSVRAHAAVADSKVTRNALVRYPSQPCPAIRPVISYFNGEIHSTVDLNGIIIVAPAGFTLPEHLSTPPLFSDSHSFEDYLSHIASAVPPVKPGEDVQVIAIEF